MLCSRREGLLAFLAALPSVGLAAEKAALPSKAYPFEDLRVERSGDNSFRPVLEGLTAQRLPDRNPRDGPRARRQAPSAASSPARGDVPHTRWNVGGHHQRSQHEARPGLRCLRRLERPTRHPQRGRYAGAVLRHWPGNRSIKEAFGRWQTSRRSINPADACTLIRTSLPTYLLSGGGRPSRIRRGRAER